MRTFFANFDDFLKVEFNLFHTLISGSKNSIADSTGKVESGKNPQFKFSSQIHRNKDITSTFT